MSRRRRRFTSHLGRWALAGALSGAGCAAGAGAAAHPVAVAQTLGETRPALPEYNLQGELALQGRDPVSYFPEGGGAPQAGSATLALRYRGVVYRFVSAANRDAFAAAPQTYEPAYGGWCAWAMANGGKTVDADPDNYTIEDGRLHVFYRNALVDTRDKWRRGDVATLIREAAAQWRGISGETSQPEPGPSSAAR